MLLGWQGALPISQGACLCQVLSAELNLASSLCFKQESGQLMRSMVQATAKTWTQYQVLYLQGPGLGQHL